MTYHYLIAGLNFSVTTEYDEYFNTSLEGYSVPTCEKPDVSVNVRKTKNAPKIPEDVKRAAVGINKYFCRLDGCDTVFYNDTKIDKIIALITFSNDYSNIDITVYDIRQQVDVSTKFFIFNLVGDSIHYLMQMRGGFVFHASAVSCNGEGVVFSAPSGTGKSTHTSLWLRQFKNCFLINDDAPVIRVSPEGVVMLHGTPWAGTSGLNRNVSVPLKAIVFLKQSKNNFISKMKAEKAVAPFFDGILSPTTPAMLALSLGTMDRILQSVPCYTLCCNMEHEAAELAHKYIFDNK